MAIIKSWAVGVDTTANQPAAATAGRLYLPTTAGSSLYLPQYDDGAAWQPWRSGFSIPILSPTSIAYAYITTTSYASVVATASLFMDMVRFRQARLTMWASLQIGSANVNVKVVDVTNTQDITGVITVNNTTSQRFSTSWGNLNSATYGGDVEFDLRAQSGAGGDTVKIFSAQLELR